MEVKVNELKNWEVKKDEWMDEKRGYIKEVEGRDTIINGYKGQVKKLQEDLEAALKNRTFQLSYAAHPDELVNRATTQLTSTYSQALAVKEEEIKTLKSEVSKLQSECMFIYLCCRLAYTRLESLEEVEKKLDSTAVALHQRHDVLLEHFCGRELPYDWGLIVVIDTNIVHHWNQVPGSGTGTAKSKAQYGNFSNILRRISVLIKQNCPCKVFIPFTVERELGDQKNPNNGHDMQASAQSIFSMYNYGKLLYLP